MRPMTVGEIAKAVGSENPAQLANNLPITSITTDSRPVNEDGDRDSCLFVALRGENFDGHRFVPVALNTKAAFALVDQGDPQDPRLIFCKDTEQGFLDLAGYYRSKFHPKVVGITGSVGKTTTIGKLAYQFKKAGNKVVLGAADTFRAAAVEQLDIWGERVGVPVIKQKMGSDPASVAFDTVTSAKAHGADVVIIDTAGRLHNKKGLMDELTKIKNVMRRVLPDAPHEILLVLDGSTGQNAFEQARQFVAATEVNELAITKLDGTAKGGVVIGISDQFKIPVKYIGLGEGMEDLQVFRKDEFVRSLFGK